jgi:four helix bundle protein
MRDHKSLLAWQHAHEVVVAVTKARIRHWSPTTSDIFSQLHRSALSVQLNIAEGYAFGPSRRFKYHLEMAYGSTIETIDILELVLELDLFPKSVAAPALTHAVDCRGLILGLVRRYRMVSNESQESSPTST